MTELAELAARHGLTDFVLSPGSRCAPLTLALVRHPTLRTRTVSDERAAAFMALGLAQATGRPVGLVCTSGTAALNYAPAVAEAFYQHIPLLVLTADRPPEWIDQQDGQTLRQRGVYGPHVKGSYELPVSYEHPDARWHANRLVNEALRLARQLPAGPVHLNVPLREPFYPAPDVPLPDGGQPRVQHEHAPDYGHLSAGALADLRQCLPTARRPLVLLGQGLPDGPTRTVLAALRQRGVPVVAEPIANLTDLPGVVDRADALLMRPQPALAPDLLLTAGQSVLSKNLKNFLRQHPPAQHLHFQPGGEVADPFRTLTHVFRAELSALAGAVELFDPAAGYAAAWAEGQTEVGRRLADFWPTQPFGEFAAVRALLGALPVDTELHVANSMPIRYVNLLGLPTGRALRLRANRGTSGIDGCTSTAVGAAWSTDRPVVLLTGDLAFFYDRNGLWHNYLPPNLRVVVLNNHGGGIFRLIDGPTQQPELEEYFETRQPLTAARAAADFGLGYHHAHDADTLAAGLRTLFDAPGAQLLEVETDRAVNQQVFAAFRAAMRA